MPMMLGTKMVGGNTPGRLTRGVRFNFGTCKVSCLNLPENEPLRVDWVCCLSAIPSELKAKGWSDARAHSATQLRKNPNAYFYRHVAPHQQQVLDHVPYSS